MAHQQQQQQQSTPMHGGELSLLKDAYKSQSEELKAEREKLKKADALNKSLNEKYSIAMQKQKTAQKVAQQQQQTQSSHHKITVRNYPGLFNYEMIHRNPTISSSNVKVEHAPALQNQLSVTSPYPEIPPRSQSLFIQNYQIKKSTSSQMLDSTTESTLQQKYDQLNSRYKQRGKTIFQIETINRGYRFLNQQMQTRMDPKGRIASTPTNLTWNESDSNCATAQRSWLLEWDKLFKGRFDVGDTSISDQQLNAYKNKLETNEAALAKKSAKVHAQDLKLGKIDKLVDELVAQNSTFPTDVLSSLRSLATILPGDMHVHPQRRQIPGIRAGEMHSPLTSPPSSGESHSFDPVLGPQQSGSNTVPLGLVRRSMPGNDTMVDISRHKIRPQAPLGVSTDISTLPATAEVPNYPNAPRGMFQPWQPQGGSGAAGLSALSYGGKLGSGGDWAGTPSGRKRKAAPVTEPGKRRKSRALTSPALESDRPVAVNSLPIPKEKHGDGGKDDSLGSVTKDMEVGHDDGARLSLADETQAASTPMATDIAQPADSMAASAVTLDDYEDLNFMILQEQRRATHPAQKSNTVTEEDIMWGID